MATIGTLAVNVVANTGRFQKGMKGSTKAVKSFGRAINAAKLQIAGFAGLLGVSGGFAGLGFAVKLAADAEQARVAIANMLKSMAKAKKLIAEIDKFSAVTPFEPGELRESAQKLLAFSVPLRDILPMMKTLGDLSAGTNRRMIEFVNIIGKVKDRGKLSAETLNEFGLRSVPLTAALVKTMGGLSENTNEARGQIQKLAAAGKVGFADMMKALQSLTTQGGLFGGAMEKQSRTLTGRFSTLTGNIKLFGEAIGEQIIPALTRASEATNAWAFEADNLKNVFVDTMRTIGESLLVVTARVDALKLAFADLKILASGDIRQRALPFEFAEKSIRGATNALREFSGGAVSGLAKFADFLPGDPQRDELRALADRLRGGKVAKTFFGEFRDELKNTIGRQKDDLTELLIGQSPQERLQRWVDNIGKRTKQAIEPTIEAWRKISLTFPGVPKPDFIPFATFNGKKNTETPIQTDFGQSPTAAALERGTSAAFSAARAGGASSLASIANESLAVTMEMAQDIKALAGDSRRTHRIVPGVA